MLLDKFNYCPVCGCRHFIPTGVRSRRCDACGFEFFLNAASANVAIIRNPRGELLVTRRKFAPARGTLDLPGGFAEPGETAEAGVMREVLEETGLQVREARYLFSQPNEYCFSGLIVPTLDLFFRCPVDDVEALQANDDAAECLWLPPADIRPEAFGLRSISRGVARLLPLLRI